MAYNLETITTKHTRVYHQLYDYYYFCEHTRRLSPVTMLSKVYIINGFIRDAKLQDLRQITNQNIYDWINLQSERGNTGRSINDRLAHLKAMLHWQKEMNLTMPKLQLGIIPRLMEAPPRKVYFTWQTIQKVLQQADLSTWLMIRLAFDCGLRISELRQLRMQDISANKLTIIGKGQKRRYAYLAPSVERRLRQWITEHQLDGYLWPSPIAPNRPLAACTIRQRLQAAFQRAGIQDFCPHDLRHSYATDLKRLGIPTRQIQAGLGHSSEAVTEKYLSDLDGLDLSKVYRRKYASYAKTTKLA